MAGAPVPSPFAPEDLLGPSIDPSLQALNAASRHGSLAPAGRGLFAMTCERSQQPRRDIGKREQVIRRTG